VIKTKNWILIIAIMLFLAACSSPEVGADPTLPADVEENATTLDAYEEDDSQLDGDHTYEASIDELSEFEVELSQLELAIVTLELRRENVSEFVFEETREEGAILLEQFQTSKDRYWEFLLENFERFCIEDGGVIPDDVFGCSFAPNITPGINTVRRENMVIMYRSLHNRLINIVYFVWGESIEDFENYTKALESSVAQLESTIVEVLDYIETNSPDVWRRMHEYSLRIDHFIGEEKLIAQVVTDAVSMQNQERGIANGVMSFILQEYEQFPQNCAHTETLTTDCPNWEIIEVRLREVRERLAAIINPFDFAAG